MAPQVYESLGMEQKSMNRFSPKTFILDLNCCDKWDIQIDFWFRKSEKFLKRDKYQSAHMTLIDPLIFFGCFKN